MNLKRIIAEYPNFPKKGILFRDFSPILGDAAAMSFIVEEFSKQFHPRDVDVFVGIESRGFIVASILAQKYSKGMVMLRKEGKLPGKTTKTSYTIEYGKAVLEIQKNVLKKDERVVICDDLLATGGTAKAAGKLVEEIGAKVAGFAFIIELTELNGIQRIKQIQNSLTGAILMVMIQLRLEFLVEQEFMILNCYRTAKKLRLKHLMVKHLIQLQ